jgi:hypothetical protein
MSVAAPEKITITTPDGLEELWNEGMPKCEMGVGGRPCPNDAAWIGRGRCDGCEKPKDRFTCSPCKQQVERLLALGYMLVCRYCGQKHGSIEWRPL